MVWPTTKLTRQKCRPIDDDFDGHDAARAIRCDAHCPIERIRGFMQSHYMPPSGVCPCHIAPAAAMVNEFVETTQKLTNTTFS